PTKAVRHHRQCILKGCGKPRHGDGLCVKHYSRMRTGKPLFDWRDLFILDNPPANGIGLIPLPGGLVTIVDEADYWKLVKYPWSRVRGRNDQYYAVRGDGKGGSIYMHKVIFKANEVGDHKN